MVMSALDSFMTKVSWAPLDILVIDMPPGTGNVLVIDMFPDICARQQFSWLCISALHQCICQCLIVSCHFGLSKSLQVIN